MSKSPDFYRSKWYNHYKKLADAKGVKFTKKHWARIENGFAYKEWAKDNGKGNNLNGFFQWFYTDHIQDLIFSGTRLIDLIRKEPEPTMTLRLPVPIKKPYWNKQSHVHLWRNK